MLHYLLNRRLVRESHARAALQRFANLGAAIHRVDDSKEFQLLIPIRRPHRRNALYKQLTRQAFGEEFLLVDVTSFVAGPQFVEVSEAEADELLKSKRFVKVATAEPVSDDSEFGYVQV